MKKIIPYLTVFAMLLTLSSNSCDDDIEDVLDVDISTTISESLDLHLNQGQETIIENQTIDLSNNDTKNYLDKIKDVKITKLTYKIINFSGDPDGSIAGSVFVEGHSFGPGINNIKNAYDNSTVFEISDTNKLNAIAELLQTSNQISLGVNGESACPNGAVDFTIEVTVHVDITANPL